MKYSSEDDYNSSDEDFEEYHELLQKEKKQNEIKRFSLEDYFKCEKTKDLIINEWEEKFENTLAIKIMHIFNRHYEYLQKNGDDIFYYANKNHLVDLCNLVKYHVQKEYTTEMFDENPELAQPLIESYSKIKKQEQIEEKKKMSKAFISANKEYNW